MRVPAAKVAHRILSYLQERGYETAYAFDEVNKSWATIQARKFSKIRTATGNRRALNVEMRKNKDKLTITIGSGQWGKNTIISAIPMAVFPVLGFMNFVGSAMSSKSSEQELWYFIDEIATQY